MKRVFLFLFIFLANSSLICASNDYLSLFNSAETCYKKAQYSKAIEIYEDIVSHNQKNSALYYNLGNAYYKNAQIGKAVISYERAKRFSPQDISINNNLALAKRIISEPESSFFESLLNWFCDLTTLNVAAMFVSFFYFLCIFGLILFSFRKSQILFLLSLIALIFVVISSGLFVIQYNDQILNKWAIVISQTDARNGPGNENSVGFSLPEGKKVSILSEQSGWYAIGLKKEGLKGWVEKKFVEAI